MKDYFADLLFLVARAYRLDGCAETGENANYFDVPAGSTVPRCYAQQRVDSVKFL